MGFYEQTFRRIDELVLELDGANAEGVIDIYDELKRIRRDICRKADTRQSYLVPRVTRALNKARARIVEQKDDAVKELYDVQKNDAMTLDNYLQMCHTAAVLFAVIAFYVLVFSTGRV
jgi:hypothetical protein